VLTALAILLTQVLWMSYGGVMAGDLAAMLVVVARNAVLIVLSICAMVRLRTTDTDSREKTAENAQPAESRF
jgi:hypothetical protein